MAGLVAYRWRDPEFPRCRRRIARAGGTVRARLELAGARRSRWARTTSSAAGHRAAAPPRAGRCRSTAAPSARSPPAHRPPSPPSGSAAAQSRGRHRHNKLHARGVKGGHAKVPVLERFPWGCGNLWLQSGSRLPALYWKGSRGFTGTAESGESALQECHRCSIRVATLRPHLSTRRIDSSRRALSARSRGFGWFAGPRRSRLAPLRSLLSARGGCRRPARAGSPRRCRPCRCRSRRLRLCGR